MKTIRKLFLFTLLTLIAGCSGDSPVIVETGPTPVSWLIPQDEVIDSGVGMDGIPSVDNPQFSLESEVNKAFDDDLVIGIEFNGELRAYPVPMMDWHEVVNDDVNGLKVAITYCPLTGTAIGWERQLNKNVVTTFGVSGFLYNTNLMPYDRRTNSLWSQQRLECVNGPFIGNKPKTYHLMETTFATWKKSFPGSKVMNANTGFDRRYSFYPYGNYRQDNDQFFFPIGREDNRIPNKERVLGVFIGEITKAYRFNESQDGTDIIADNIAGSELIIVRSKKDNFNTAFLNPDHRIFKPVQNGLPSIMIDENSNEYDLAGRIISGPNIGTRLQKPLSFIGYWFSWASFYPEIEIYTE